MKLYSKSLSEFYENNELYRKNINEGFFGELFKGILKAFAALFGIEIDENADNSYTSSNNRFDRGAREAIDKGIADVKALKLPDDTDVTKLNWDDFDPEKAPDEESRQARIKLRDDVMAEVLRLELEGVSTAISALDDVPAFLEGVDDNIKESRSRLISEQQDQYKKYERQISVAGAGLGQLIGVSRFVKEKIPEFEFEELEKPQTPGDLMQQASYYAFKLEPRGRDNTDEPRKVIDFGSSYSSKNNFSIELDSASHVPSKSVEGEQGEAIKDAAEELGKELTPEEIEELDPSDYILLDDNELPDTPKDGISNSLKGWFDSISKTSQDSLKAGDKIGNLRDALFGAIDKSTEVITREVEDAVGLWRDENEEALINSKRFAKKNFDSLQDLVPKMVATILSRQNESKFEITRKSLQEFVFTFLDKKFQKGAAILKEEEEVDPEKEADPTDEVQASTSKKLSVKDSIADVLDSWGKSLSPTSQDSLKKNLKGDSLKDIIFVAVDGAAEVVSDEVKRAVAKWRSEHEEVLIRSKRFAKKNFDSLEELIPDMVAKIVQKTNESSGKISRNQINKSVVNFLNSRFLQSKLIKENRWQTLAGIIS